MRSILIWFTLLGVLLATGAIAQPTKPSAPQPNSPRPNSQTSPRLTCPNDVETLIPLLLRDLPSYTNRANQRLLREFRKFREPGYMVVAGRPEFQPLTLGPGEYLPTTLDAVPDLRQVFFTTRERQYTLGKSVDIQQFHWLFLAQSKQGWLLALLFSQVGTYPAEQPPSPPEDTSDGAIAQAIRTWLQDCQAGSIRPLKAPLTNQPNQR